MNKGVLAMWEMLWNEHRGKCIGTALGFVLGIVYLFNGFWDMIIFASLLALGFYVGLKIDSRENLWEVIDRILPGKFKK